MVRQTQRVSSIRKHGIPKHISAMAAHPTLATIDTTTLERLARDYERGTVNRELSEFETSAILRGIQAEVVDRDILFRSMRTEQPPPQGGTP